MSAEIRGHFPDRTFRKESGYPVEYECGDSCGRDWTVRIGANGVRIVETPPTHSMDDYYASMQSVEQAVKAHWRRVYDPRREAPE